MSKLREQVLEIRFEVSSMNQSIQELEKPLEKPVVKDYSNSNDYLIAIRNHQEGEHDRTNRRGAIEEFLPIQSERLKALEIKLKAEESESWQFYQSMCEKVEKFCSDYEVVRQQFEELKNLTAQTPQAWRSQHQGEQILDMRFPPYALEKLRIGRFDPQQRFAFYYGKEMVQKFEEQSRQAAIAG